MLGRNWLGALICLLLAGGFFSFGYWQGQRSLQSQLQALTAQVADSRHGLGNPWTGAGAMRPPMPFLAGAGIPANASPEMKEFLQNRQALMQKMAELRQQNPGAAPQDLQAQFRQQNQALLARQQELAQKMGQDSSRNILPTPPTLQIPAIRHLYSPKPSAAQSFLALVTRIILTTKPPREIPWRRLS